MKQKRRQTDLIIVGAGPAGLSAAVVAAENDLNVTVVDEFMTPGGRMLGQFHNEPGKGWWIGKQIATELIEQIDKLGVRICCGVSVYSMHRTDNGWEVSTSQGAITSPYVLLATGAAEIPLPTSGWTLPGVMSIGAAQVMTNVHYVKPGKRGLIIGVNVLAMAIASELAVSGVSLAGIVLPSGSSFAGKAAEPKKSLEVLMDVSHLAPSLLLRMGGRITKAMNMTGSIVNLFPRRGVKIGGIPLMLRTTALSINGVNQVESVTLADVNAQGVAIPGSEREEAVDFVALSGGLYPLAELASVAGCPFIYVSELGGHIPLHSERMQTPLKGLYVAGNITGVESALVAMSQGQLAATSICHDAGTFGKQGEQKVVSAVDHVDQVRSSALIQFHPGIAAARRRLYRMWQETMKVGV